MRVFVLAASAAALMLPLLAGAGQAQNITIGPGGVRIDDGRRPPPPPPGVIYERERDRFDVSRRDAERIARRQGVVEIIRAERRRATWVVEGYDDDGLGLRIVISADTGEVLDRSRRRL